MKIYENSRISYLVEGNQKSMMKMIAADLLVVSPDTCIAWAEIDQDSSWMGLPWGEYPDETEKMSAMTAPAPAQMQDSKMESGLLLFSHLLEVKRACAHLFTPIYTAL